MLATFAIFKKLPKISPNLVTLTAKHLMIQLASRNESGDFQICSTEKHHYR
jgi:hypothetical protein